MIDEIDSIARAVENTDPTPPAPVRDIDLESKSHCVRGCTRRRLHRRKKRMKRKITDTETAEETTENAPEVVPASSSALSDPDWFVNSPLTAQKPKKVAVTPRRSVRVKVTPKR